MVTQPIPIIIIAWLEHVDFSNVFCGDAIDGDKICWPNGGGIAVHQVEIIDYVEGSPDAIVRVRRQLLAHEGYQLNNS